MRLLTLLAAGLLGGCSATTSPVTIESHAVAQHGGNMSQSNETRGTLSPCRAVVERLMAKQLADLPVLPMGCKLDEQQDVLIPLSPQDGAGVLGREYRKRASRLVRISGYAEPVRAWHEGGKLLLLELDGTDVRDGWPALRDTLGTPDAKVGFDWATHEVQGGHWIYARRGLAFYLRYGDEGLVRFVVFPPTTVAGYLDELELHLGTVEREVH